MNHASLFSGIGGAEIAAEWMGWENAFHVEINPFGRKILEYWYPNSISYEDITKTDFSEWRGRIDVLTAGFPCQPFSLAGQRKGADDDRYLWPQVVRAVHEIKPAWVVGENVAGILTMVQPGEEVEVGSGASLFGETDRKRVLLRQEYVIETVCRDLEREGYKVRPFVIPACAVGAPHRRDRVWIVARRTQDDNNVLRGENTCGFGGFSVFESMELEDKPLRLRLSDNKVKGRWQEMEIYLNAQIDLLSERERRSRPYQQEQTGQQEAKPADCSSLGELSQHGKGNRREETERTKQMVCADLCERGKEIPWMLRHERRSDGCKDSCGTPPVAHRADAGAETMQCGREDRICASGIASIPGSQRCDNGCDNRGMRQVRDDRERHAEESKPERNERERRACKDGTTTTDTQCFVGREIHNEVQSQQSDGQRTYGNGCERLAAYTTNERLQRRMSHDTILPAEYFSDFPTQSPVCSRDDGISLGLAGITFPKWRQESIKALGNAMCPEVVYEIFRAIEENHE